MGKSSGAGSPLATGAMFFGAGFGIASTFSRMPGIRGTFSIGAVSGALCGWLCVWFGVPLGWQLPTVSIVLMGVMGLATTHYLQDRIPRSCVGTGPFRGAVVSGPRTLPLSKSVTGQE